MNYNINIDELGIDKIIIPKKNYYCTNCNRKGHTFKTCNEAIISNGIIAIYIKGLDNDIISHLENYIIKNLRIFSNYYGKKTYLQNNKYSQIKSDNVLEQDEDKTKISYNTFDDNAPINKNIQFLMVQRKHSLGYLEFMRGRYSINNLDSIVHLLEQMTPEELNDINATDFDTLWNNLWDSNNIRNKNHHKEYITSKQKFYQLKLLHDDILTKTEPQFSFNEWGFPKGRREPYESDLVCAIREFEEETMLNEKDYIVLEKCKSIRENLIGTNGVGYAHNYFLSVLNNTSCNLDENNREIGQAKVLTITECLEKIRPYHKNKIRIIKCVYSVINNFLNELALLDE